ncbi:MAG: PAS domain-containing protein, partial [Sphingomonadales bacterium]|nr:PAS domain-containing protein [Sphingomonadales bacterium]
MSKNLFTVDAIADEADLVAPTLRDLYDYWQRLRVNGALPHRRDINPAD